MRVENAFEDYLGRTATPQQVYNVVATAEATHTSVRAIILGSPEYIADNGGTAADYASALATSVLGTASYQAYLTTQLASGNSPTEVAEGLLLSDPGETALLSDTFDTLGFAPSNQQLASGVQLMKHGVLLWQITASLLATDTFYSSVTGTS